MLNDADSPGWATFDITLNISLPVVMIQEGFYDAHKCTASFYL